MSKERISMNSESILGFASNLNNSSSKTGDSGRDVLNQFQGMNKLAGETTSVISKQLASISDSMNNYKKILTNNVQKTFDFDSDMASLAERIEVPLDFTANNSMDTNKFNAIYIEKVDGESVNKGQTTKKVNEIDDSVVAAKALDDISGNVTQEQKYDGTSIIGRSVLGNISGNQTQAQTYDDSSQVRNKGLTDISGNNTNEVSLDDRTNINGSKLTDISGNSTNEVSLDDRTGIKGSQLNNISGNSTNEVSLDDRTGIKGSQLNDISGNASQQQGFTDSYVTGGSVLGNINFKGNTSQVKSDDDAVAANAENKEN
jgi:hypothetical protein